MALFDSIVNQVTSQLKKRGIFRFGIQNNGALYCGIVQFGKRRKCNMGDA